MDIPCPVKDNHQHGSADLRKEGSAYDLTLTIGILVASEQIKAIDIDKYIIMGDCLDGSTAYTRSVTYRHKS
jgi:predicted ATPase with chaperone activity